MNKDKKLKILCFTDFNSGRDVEMILPIRYFAERFLNCQFIHAISFDIYKIYQIKPDIVLIPNSKGSTLYWKIARAAFEQNVPLFSLESEGNFPADNTFNYWGYNLDKKFYQEYVCCWSERTQNYLKELAPEDKNKIVLTGGAGFDRFKIYEFLSKEEFLKKYDKKGYKKIIGYGAWTFNKVNFLRGRSDIFHVFGNGDSSLNWVEEQRKLVNNIFKETVKNYKNTLFIFKRHPQDKPSESVIPAIDEMDSLGSLENVLCFNEEESLQDLINVSDVWTCFESTTALEAWLMGKQTIFINPDLDFPRADIYKGSAVAQNFSELKTMLDEFYSTGSINDFCSEKKKKCREDIIKTSIGFNDGFNHLRVSYYLVKTIDRIKTNSKPLYRFSLIEFLLHMFTVVGGIFFVEFIYRHLYKFKKHIWVFENYKMREIEGLYKRYSVSLSEFYNKNGVNRKHLANDLFSSFLH
jgi:hypothetical protein